MVERSTHSSRLVDAIEGAHAHALADFAPGQQASMASVVWLSAHLAALDHAIHPAMQRALPAARDAMAEQRKLAGRLQTRLREIERREAGDSLSHSPLESTRRQLGELLQTYGEVEREMVAALSAEIGPDASQEVLDRYNHALTHGPTRPHPYGPHRGLLGRLAYRVDALRDHVLDTMDGRTNPMPKTPALHKTPGRWGKYLLGATDSQEVDR
jgi:hypothetical protein